ncbi:hypothetical protein BH23PAT2_BH23PAT2_07830 [soil metagenome]
MESKTTQKVIKIGSSIGVTIPARQARYLDIQLGDTVTLSITKKDESVFLHIVRTPLSLFSRLFRS